MDIVDVNTLFGPLPITSTDLSVDTLLGLMQKHQVGAACTLSTLGLMLDPAVGNAATLAACREHSELLPVATLQPSAYFGDDGPIARLKTEGFRLVRFFPSTQDWPVDFAPFAALIQSLRATGLPLMVEAERPGDATALLRLLDGYSAPVILAGVDISTLAEAVAGMRRHANWHLEISRLLAPGCLKTVAESVGSERILFGTSAAYRPIAGALQVVRYSGLTEDQIRQTLGANARRILQ